MARDKGSSLLIPPVRGRKRKFLSKDIGRKVSLDGASGSSDAARVPEGDARVESGKENGPSGRLALGQYGVRRHHPSFYDEADPRSRLAPYLHRSNDLGGPLNKAPDGVRLRNATTGHYHRVAENCIFKDIGVIPQVRRILE